MIKQQAILNIKEIIKKFNKKQEIYYVNDKVYYKIIDKIMIDNR
jgi:hypothetical protein